MSKATITRLFIGSVIAVVAGAVVMLAAIWIAYATDSFVMTGPDVTGIHSTGLAWTMVGLGVVSILALLGGAIGGLVSWIGALLNTAELEDKTWFIVLLVLGVFSFGLVAMIAYVIAGPDGHRSRATPQVGAPV
jgi:MFS family permease